MDEYRSKQIKSNLHTKSMEELLEIWQNGDLNEWEKEVFEITKEILLERLGYLPPQSTKIQVSQILNQVEQHLNNGELDSALRECQTALQLAPNSAVVCNRLGEIYEEMDQLENAIINYQEAIQLDPELRDAWENMLVVESALEEEFEESDTKRHLDQALEHAYEDEPEKALEECEMAKLSMPGITVAYNYLGLIFQTLNQFESAIDSYLKAIQLNSRFYAARENLASARLSWEEEQYRLFSHLNPDDAPENVVEFDESQIPESDEPIPQWLYMNEKSFLMIGYPGYRTRQGRSGYDPLDRNAEEGHLDGVIIRKLLSNKFRTRDPFYLGIMAYAGVLFFLYGAVPFTLGTAGYFLSIVTSPYLVVGLALLKNVYLSFQLTEDDDDNGHTFF